MDTPLSRKNIANIKKRKNFPATKSTSRVCDILKIHVEDLKADPERLKSDFLLQLILENDGLYNYIVTSIFDDNCDLIMNRDILKYFLKWILISKKKY